MGTHAPTSASQVAHPWTTVLRTVFQGAVGLAAAFPTLVGVLHLPSSAALAAALAVAALITRLMAMPAVEGALQVWAPWLAAEPTPRPAPSGEPPSATP